MREIKFRGLSIETGKMVYGNYYKCPWLDYKNWIRVLKDSHFIDIAIKEDTLGQFTGLKDKNGKLIFEGDIIKGLWNYVGIVIYDNDFLQYRIENGREIDYYGLEKLEIIGNIYENKNLLDNK